MTPAVFAVTNVEVDATPRGRRACSRRQGSILKFDGYRHVLAPAGKQEDALLPPLTEKQTLDLLDLTPTPALHRSRRRATTRRRWSRRWRRKASAGRAPTPAIISKIQERGYVEQKERRFYATEIGMTVTDLLVEHFPKVMDLKFTAHMEEELDEIETAKIELRRRCSTSSAGRSREALDEAEDEDAGAARPRDGRDVPEVRQAAGRATSARRRAGSSSAAPAIPEGCKYIKPGEGEAARPAPVRDRAHVPDVRQADAAAHGPARRRSSAAAGYPECKTTMNLDAEGKPVLTAKPTEHICEKCGKPMVLREGRRGPFLACTGYPKCKNAKDVDAEGNPIPEVDLLDYARERLHAATLHHVVAHAVALASRVQLLDDRLDAPDQRGGRGANLLG